jgi:PKD repeat protein
MKYKLILLFAVLLSIIPAAGATLFNTTAMTTGSAYYSSSNTSWFNIHDSPIGGGNYSDYAYNIYQTSVQSGKFGVIHRTGTVFNKSGVPLTDITITNASIHYQTYPTTAFYDDFNDTFNIVSFSPINYTYIAKEDYPFYHWGTTPLATRTRSGMSNLSIQYVDYLNQEGLAYLMSSGNIVPFGFRHGRDIINSAPDWKYPGNEHTRLFATCSTFWLNITYVSSNIPNPTFTQSGSNLHSPALVKFTDTSTGIPTSWNWTFTNITGNNTEISFSTVASPAYTFGSGNFSIKLNATNANGTATSTTPHWVNTSGSLNQIGHPRLYFNSTDIATLQARTTDPTYSPVWDAMYDVVINHPRTDNLSVPITNGFDTIYYLRLNGFVYAVSGNTIAGDRGKACLMNVVRWPNWTLGRSGYDPVNYTAWEYPYEASTIVTGVAEAYDMLYPLLNDTEKLEVQDALISKGIEPYYRDYTSDSRYLSTNGGVNRGLRGYSAAGLATLAILNDTGNETLPLYYNTILQNLFNYTIAYHDANGLWTEGLGYEEYESADGTGSVYYLAATKKVLGADPVANYPNYTSAMKAYTYLFPPDKLSYGDGFNDQMSNGLLQEAMVDWFTHDTGNHLAQWYHDNVSVYRNFGYINEFPGIFLWHGSITPEDPNLVLPTSVLFQQVGVSAFRSGFGRDHDTLIGFTSTPMPAAIGTHYRPEQNNFFYDALGERFIITSGESSTGYSDPYYTPYMASSRGQNTILVNNDTNSQYNYTYTGATARKYNPPHTDPAGLITQFSTSSIYDVVTGDATAAYKGSITKFNRTIVWIKPKVGTEGGVLILYDDVANGVSTEYDELFHTYGTVAGNQLTISGNNLTFTQPTAKMYMHVLSPPTLTITTHDAPTTSYVYGINKNMVYTKIKPTADSATMGFLAVMYPSFSNDMTGFSLVNNTTHIGTTITHDNISEKVLIRKSDYYVTYSLEGTSPFANFSYYPSSGSKPLTVTFTDTSNNTPTGWYWEFGDGNMSTDQSPTHTYVSNGSYSVNFRSSNDIGSSWANTSNIINVTTAAPATTINSTSAASLCNTANTLPSIMGILATVLAFGIITDFVLLLAMVGAEGESRRLMGIILVVVTILIGVCLIVMASFIMGSIPTTLACQ